MMSKVMKSGRRTPDRGDIIDINLNPTKGHEQQGTRPVLVLTPKAYNKKRKMMMAVPITSQYKKNQIQVSIEGCEHTQGYVLTEHLRSLDWTSRGFSYRGKAPEEVLRDTCEIIYGLVVNPDI